MKDFFVDFENVHSTGLEGIETLSRLDRIFLFYSDAAESINIDQIVNCKARLKFIKIGNGQRNALDFQLVAFLFSRMKRWRRYYIVSKDKGFTSVTEMAGNLGVELQVIDKISSYKALEKSMKTKGNIVVMADYEGLGIEYGIDKAAVLEISKEIEDKTGSLPEPERLRMVISGLKNSSSKSEFYLYCTKNMGQTKGQQFYSCLKKSYTKIKQIVELAS